MPRTGKFGILKELFGYLLRNKKWWLIPVIVLLVLLGLIIVLGQTTALGPFIYALF
jgi:hypothetical protein